jgi:hypothetical protein
MECKFACCDKLNNYALAREHEMNCYFLMLYDYYKVYNIDMVHIEDNIPVGPRNLLRKFTLSSRWKIVTKNQT